MRDSLSFYEHAPPPAPLSIVSVPTELGSDARGLSEAPEYLYRHGLKEMLCGVGAEVAEEVEVPCRELEAATAATAKAVAAAALPLVLGGDHSAALGSMSGASQKAGRLGVIYIDAHPDCNTPDTSPTGNAHGMVASAAMEYVRPQDFLFIGLKDFDPAEVEFLRERQSPCFTMLDLARRGFPPVMQAVDELARRTERVWVSFDLDSVDRAYAPGVAMPNDAGLTAREALALAQYIGGTCELAGIDLVELLPAADQGGKTAALALDILARLLGGEWGAYRAYLKRYEPAHARSPRSRA